ncbi:MAG: type II toxin-antitoxin system VapC family toxin, partial [Brevundimonas sp.]
MTNYLDASIVAASLLRETTSLIVDQFILESINELAISDFAIAEVSSAISRYLRMGKCDEAAAEALIQDLDGWPGR